MVVKLKKDEFTGFDLEVEVPEGVFKLDCFDPIDRKSYVRYYYWEGSDILDYGCIREAQIKYEN